MPTISIPYGSEQITLAIPDQNFQETISPNPVKLPTDETKEIETAIHHPIGCPELKNIVNKDSQVAIICDDITRPTPAYKVLPALLDGLNKAGVPDSNIFIVMALGSHRYMTEAEMDQKVGLAIRKRILVYNSEFRDKKGLIDLGYAPGGVRIWADKRVMEATIRIGVGSIVPHPAVGWSGGGKIIYPGVTGEDTVAAFHRLHGRVPWNMFGTDKSPVRESMEQWVETVGLHFIVNLVCLPNGSIYKAVAGHYLQAHRVGVEYAKQLYAVRAKSRVEIAIVSSHPADLDLWQAGKAIISGEFLVKDGGILILVTPCPEGAGPHPLFTQYSGIDNVAEYLEQEVSSEEMNVIAAAAGMVRVRKRIRVGIVSDGLDKKAVAECQFTKFDSVVEALSESLSQYGPSAKVAVVGFGADIFPYV